MKTLFLIMLTSGLVHFSLFGQDKLEREYRLKKEDVPASAQDYIQLFGFKKKVKWYKEEGLVDHTIEAKTKHNKQKYSVEFDSLGNLQDLEVEIDWQRIPKSTQSQIDRYLNSIFTEQKITKIQVQYTGSPKAVLSIIQGKGDQNSHTLKYEMIVKGKKAETINLYECLFSEAGMFERMSLIVFRNTDNLEY